VNARIYDAEYACEVAAALVETLDDARLLARSGFIDADLVAASVRAHDLQTRFRALVTLAGREADERLAAICASTEVFVTHLLRVVGEPIA
jgi:hypothetical protein